MKKEYVLEAYRKVEEGQKVLDSIVEWADAAVQADPERKNYRDKISIRSDVALHDGYLHFYAYYPSDVDCMLANDNPVRISLEEFEHITASEFLAKVNAQIKLDIEAENQKRKAESEKEERRKYEELKRKFEKEPATA